MLKILLKSGFETVKANLFKNYKYPIGVYLCITPRCNLNCRYCDFDKLSRNHKPEFSTKDIFSLIDEMSEAGVKKINLTGGEPLLHSGIDEIIDYLKSKKIFTALSTNGLLAERHINSLKKIDAIMISFDGTKENHDIMRGKGSYERVIESFEILKKNSINFWTTTTLNKYNIDDIECVVENAERYNTYANFVLIQYFKNPNEINSLPEYERIKDFIPQPPQIKKAFEKLIEIKKRKGESVQLSVFLNL